MNKKFLEEVGIRTRLITPAITGPDGMTGNILIKAGNFNLDLKIPRNSDEGPSDVDQLPPEYEKLLARISEPRAVLKKEL
jgi:hypothetical protein